MDHFITEHWGVLAWVLGGVGAAIAGASVFVGKGIRDGIVWLGTKVIRPIVDGHLEFLQKSLSEQETQSDTLAKMNETTVSHNDKLDRLINEISSLKDLLEGAMCKYEGKEKEHPKGRGGKLCP